MDSPERIDWLQPIGSLGVSLISHGFRRLHHTHVSRDVPVDDADSARSCIDVPSPALHDLHRSSSEPDIRSKHAICGTSSRAEAIAYMKALHSDKLDKYMHVRAARCRFSGPAGPTGPPGPLSSSSLAATPAAQTPATPMLPPPAVPTTAAPPSKRPRSPGALSPPLGQGSVR